MRECTVVLACDGGCGATCQSQVGATVDDLRQLLAEVGWKSDKARDRDLCPSCLARGLV